MPPHVKFQELSQELQDNAYWLSEKLEELRNQLDDRTVIINTYSSGGNRKGAGYRPPEYNRAVGGIYKGKVLPGGRVASRNSYHTEFLAADIYVVGKTVHEVARAAKAVGFTEVLPYESRKFTHVALEHLSSQE